MVESVASRTQITSSNRSSSRLSKSIDLNQSLRDLPLIRQLLLHFYNFRKNSQYSSLDMSLQDLLDEINSTNNGVDGINPEGDSVELLLVTIQIKKNGRVNRHFRTRFTNLMVLGSSTDTSNFLHAMKLTGPPSAGSVTSTNALASIDMKFHWQVQTLPLLSRVLILA